jgi:hypothetical protein
MRIKKLMKMAGCHAAAKVIKSPRSTRTPRPGPRIAHRTRFFERRSATDSPLHCQPTQLRKEHS